MPKIAYKTINFKPDTLATIHQANQIIEEYQAAGYDLTLRQLYYQLVARDLIENTDRTYKNLSRIVSDARDAGLMDWSAIVDRTRQRRTLSTWDNPGGVLRSAYYSYRMDLWDNQTHRPMVWVEKEALAGVVQRACFGLGVRVPFMSCKGYMSASSIWQEAMRLASINNNQIPVVIHLADHDPSGIDMSRDNQERLLTYSGMMSRDLVYSRIALNMDQIQLYNPPPNPAKISDSRYASYVVEYGTESWELDALKPEILVALIEKEVNQYKDEDTWKEDEQTEAEHRTLLKYLSENWKDLDYDND